MLRFSSVVRARSSGCSSSTTRSPIAVTQRRREIGILRALGASRRQVALLFVGESAIGGLVGSALGVIAGYALAGVVAGRAATFLRGIFGDRPGRHQRADRRAARRAGDRDRHRSRASLAAAWPARSAASVDPIKALQKGRAQVLSAGSSRARMLVAAIAAAAGVTLIAATAALPFFYVGYACVMVAALLLTPALSLWLVRALAPLLQRIRPVEGALAIDSLIGAPRRTSATVAALMLAIALVIGIGGAARATYSNIHEWAVDALNPDFFVTPSPSLTERDYRFPDSMTARAHGARRDPAGAPHAAAAHRVPRHPPALHGDGCRGARRHLSEKGARRRSRRDVSPRGGGPGGHRLRELRVAATSSTSATRSSSRRRPARFACRSSASSATTRISRDRSWSICSLYRKYWNDDSIDFFRVYLTPGADASAVKERDPPHVLERPPPLRALEPRGARLRRGADGPVVRHDAHADCDRHPRRRARHRQLADRLDCRPAARAGRAAGGRRDCAARSAAPSGWRR